MAEISKPPGGGEVENIFIRAQIDRIQAQWRPGRQQVGDPIPLLVAHRQDAHFDRHIAIHAVISDHGFFDPLGGHQLADKSIIIDMDIMD